MKRVLTTLVMLSLVLGGSRVMAAAPGGFPIKGKPITLIVPYAAGGNSDIAGRILATALEKEIGTSVQVVNRPGASGQIGHTELARAKPDGYTLGYTQFPSVITSYLDPARKAIYTRTSFQPVASHWLLPAVVTVEANSRFKTLQDVVDAAKANPEKIKAGTNGLQSFPHLANVRFQQAAKVKFAVVHFDGGNPEMISLLGGHIDVAFNGLSEVLTSIRGGKLRALGIMDKKESKALPGVKTVEALGYKAYGYTFSPWSVPAGTPKPIVEYLATAMRKAMSTPEHMEKMDQLGYETPSMTPEQISALWIESEEETKSIMELIR